MACEYQNCLKQALNKQDFCASHIADEAPNYQIEPRFVIEPNHSTSLVESILNLWRTR